jgi:hypothetical protein
MANFVKEMTPHLLCMDIASWKVDAFKNAEKSKRTIDRKRPLLWGWIADKRKDIVYLTLQFLSQPGIWA